MKKVFVLLFLVSSLLADFVDIVNIHDGDSVTAITNEKDRVKIRLYGIDAPELKQPYGREAKRHLSKLTAKKDIKIVKKGKDRYGRTLAVLYSGNKDINAKMVSDGYAWAYTDFSKDYKNLQTKAKNLKKGLWRDQNAVKPSDFRKSKRLSKKHQREI
ncbi:MAG: thermonuclease family protein [Campylobacter sp.]